MTNATEFQGNVVLASDINPFDMSYHFIQHAFDSEVMSTLSKISNLTIKIITTPLVTDLLAYKFNPDVWIVEQIVNGSSEISSTSMVLTSELPNSVEYSTGIETFRPQIYFKIKTIREQHNIYLVPFSTDVWACLFGLLLAITAVLTFILWRETKLPHSTPYDIIARIADYDHDDDETWNESDPNLTSRESLLQRERWEVGEIVLITIGALCQQGSARDPSTSAARTLLLALFILAVLTYTAYSASVISLISLLPFTQDDRQADLNLDLMDTSKALLTDTNIDWHRKLPHRKAEYTSLECGVSDAIKGKAAFIGDRDVTQSILHSHGYCAELRCGLGRLSLGIKYQRVVAFRKGSQYQQQINFNILRLRQFGILSRMKKKLFNTRPLCDRKERSKLSGFVSIDIYDIKPALHMLSWGLALSVFVLLLEHLVFFSSKFLQDIFENSWRKVDKDVENILTKWYKKRISRTRNLRGK